MRYDVSNDGAIEDALGELIKAERAELIPTVAVVGQHDARLGLQTAARGRWRVEVDLENGESRVIEGEGGEIHIPDLPLGYHSVRFITQRDGRELVATQRRIVTPSRCVLPRDVLGEQRVFGLTANLYTLRSKSNWGVGDFTDLCSVAEWGAANGAEFVGVNPLHALLNRGYDVSPYSPVSRLFRNPLYIDVLRIPALLNVPDIAAQVVSPEIVAELEALRESPDVRYAQVWAVKSIVLDALHRTLAQRSDPAFDAFVAEGGESLRDFATWMAIAEQHGTDARRWPEALRDPRSRDVAALASESASRIHYHLWLQYEADRQLAEAAASARDAGMRIGLYQDLAVGSSPAGSDVWAFASLFARGAAVGAPPDPYAMQGQNWGFPPIDPRQLRASGYAYFIQLLRGAFRHSGALRIDHVLGLFRLFWIPDGASGSDGAYVRYPTDDLFGIIALESARNNALVVGEDLGTVPPEVPSTLARWGVLSSKVMFFEREHDGAFRAPATYPELALATADTHDMAPIAGFWNGVDIDIRHSVGLIDDSALDDERRLRDQSRGQLSDRLSAEQILPSDVLPQQSELTGAVHAMMCRTPSALVGIALDDVAGERTPVNVPGVGQDKFLSWSRKMRDSIEVTFASEDAQRALRCDGRRGVRHG